MIYVVDACNLIFCDRKLEETLEKQGFQAARDLLVAMLSRFASAEGLESVIAVFDGSEKGAHRPRIQRECSGKVVLVYADPRANADRYIVDLVEDARQPGQITVVTSDKFIIRHVLKARGHHAASRDFLRNMRRAVRRAADPLGGEDPRKFAAGLTPREIEDWMRWFGFKEGE